MSDDNLRGILDTLDPKARDSLRCVLIRGQGDRDAIASDLLRKGRASTQSEKEAVASHEATALTRQVRLPFLGRWSDAPTPLYVLRCSAAGWSSGPDRGSQWLALRFNPGPRR